MVRSFIAIEIPEGVRHKINQMINDWDKMDYPLRWVKEDNLHLTLKFLGEITEPMVAEVAKRLRSVAQRFSPFQVSLKGLGSFPSPSSPRVIWIGVAEGRGIIKSLQGAIEDELTQVGLKPESREFSPHLTIARAKSKFDAREILETQYESPIFLVKSLVFFKSTLTPEGPIYDKLAEFSLTTE